MFDKIQSTYFKRVTTGVLALFMTASSGFSYAVPVYAEEVTTAAAKRKKEEEFSSTESSTLQLNENSTKEEVIENKEDKSSNTTEKTLTTKTTEVSDEKVQNESQRSDEDIQKEKQEMKSNFKVADIDYSSLKKSEYAKDKLEYDDKSLQKLFDYKIEIEQISFDDALKSVEDYIANNEFDFYEFLCKISQNDPYKLFYSLSDADREKALKQCNEKEQYALKYLLMYSGLDFIQQNRKNNENKTFYVESLSKYFDDFKKFNKDNNLGEDVHDFDMLMDNFFQMRKENYRKNIVYLIESHSELINKIINILNDSSKWNKSGINEIEKICNNKFQVKQNSGILKEKTKVSYTKGGFYLAKEAGSTQRTNVTLTRKNAPAWSNFTSTAYTYNISTNNSTLIPNGWIETKNSTPVYSSNKVKARKDQKTGFTVLYFRVTYTQPAHYKKDQADHDKANCDNAGRMNFFKYSAANDSTENTFMDDLVHANTDRAVNYQINMMQCGLRDDAEGSHHGHAATEGGAPSFGSTLKYKKPTHTVRYYDSVNSNPIDTRSVSDGNKASSAGVPSDPTRTGYRFIGWRNTANESPWDKTICGTENFYAKWQKQYRLDVNGRLNGGSIQGNTNGMGTFDVFVNGTQTRWSDRDAWDMIDDGATVEIKNIKADSGIHYSGNSTISFTMNGDKTDGNAIILDFTSGATLSIDPNGGTYKGSSGVTTVNHLSPGETITVDSPTRPGYKFGGYEKSNESYQSYASNTGWTTSHGENVGTYSRSYDGNVSLNEAPDGGYYRTNHVWRGIDSATDNYNCISFPTYTAQAGHTYKISGEVWISERPSGGSFALNFYHGDSSNDWKHCMWGISEGWTGKWVKFSMERTFDTTTNDARFEIWTSNLKGLTGNISFWLQGLKITDETTGNDVSMTKIAMGDSDIKLTARWIPLHSTLSYDAQGGSLDSVKSTDNPNNYKIVDNGDYFIQSGLNSSRYLHDYDCSAENGAKVCTFQGYGANAKQCIWTFERYKNTPYYYIINKYNGKALNLSGDGPGDLSGQTVEMWTQLNAANENQSDFLWYFKDAGDGYVTICNKYTDKALDIPNGEDNDNVKLQQYTPNGTASQKFKLVNNSQVYFPTREKYTGSNVYINSATPVKKGCKFLGWNTKEDGSGKIYQPGDLYDVNQDGGNVTLYAQWEKEKYTATVKLNGGSYNGSTKDFTISKYPGEEISVGAPTRSKHNFAGYKLTMDNNDGDAPTSVTQSASGFKGIMQMGNFTLNAQWTPWKHTVRYDANAKNDTSVKGIPASQSKTANVDIKLSSGVPTRNGYTFLGWNTQADGNGTAYAAGATYTHDQNGGTVTLYAQWTPWKHVLHYNKNVPTSSTSQTVSNMPVDQTKTFGQLMTISNLVPTREGYTFAGWYTQSNGTGTKYNPGSNYAADQNGGTVNLYAKWTPWTYKIKYDKNVSSSSSSQAVNNMPEDQSKTQEINVILSDNKPTRNGYIFNGWQVNGTGMIYQPGATFSQDGDSNGATITLKAKWTPWKHTVHFDKNVPASSKSQTVSNIPSDVTKTFDQKLTLNSTKPTRKGYSFKEWNTKADGSGTSYAAGGTYDQDHNGGTVTLYAIWTAWTHTVTYNKNVPSNAPSNTTAVTNLPGNQTKTYEKNLTLSTTKPSRTGYNFVEWNTQADGKGTSYKSGSVYSYDRDSNGGTVTLYAIWTPWKHTVTYNKNVPASSKSQTVNSLPGNQTKIYDQTLTLSNNTPTRTGYTFKEWNTQADGKGTSYQKGASYTYNRTSDGGIVTLYAIWTSWKHTVHYDKNVSSTSSSQTVSNMPSDQTKVYETNLVLSTSKPTRNGYIFTGWNTAANGSGTAYAAGGNYQYDRSNDGGTVTLYAQWTAWKHTVHYDKNVPSTSSSQTVNGIPADQTKTFDQKLTLSATKPTRNGYIFSGWNTKTNGSGTAYAAGAEYKHDQNGGTATLYAQWTAWKHTVHYNANGGDQNSVPTDQTKTFDQAMILSDKKPTRHGYNFVRWNTKADGTGTSYEVKGNYNHDQNGGTVTLYAIWTPWVHTVHYDANGGDQNSVPNDQKKTYGQSMNVATKVPTRNEYKFLGWTTGKDGSGTFYNPGDAYYHDQNGQTVTLYAKWVQLYTVKYDGNQPAIKGVTVTGSVANQTQGQDESVNLRTNNFKNDSGVYKDWSVGKDAYKYAVKSGIFRKYIHPEGFKTNHSTMQNELYDYTGGIAHQ